MTATVPPKVLMRIPVSPNSGYGNDGIQFTMALLKAGVDVRLHPTTLAPPLPPAVASLLTKTLDAPFDLFINHVDPGQLECTPQARAASAITVAHTMWEFCVDNKTEIFTQRGWLTYDRIISTDKTLGLTEEGKASWVPILDVHVFEDKTRKLQSMCTQGHSSLTTTNHKWLIKNQQNQWVWKTSEELNSASRIPRNATVSNNPKNSPYSDDFVELVAWTYTEGWLERGKSVRIGQNSFINSKETVRIRSVLRRLYGDSVRRNHPKATDKTWSESSKPDGMVIFNLSRQVSSDVLKVCPEKVPSLNFLNCLTQQQLELFVEVSVLADGSHITENNLKFVQNRGPRLDTFVHACILAGFAVTAEIGQSRCTSIRVNRKGQHFVNPVTRGQVELLEHKGIVWCPTTPTGTWLARREGHIYYTGNTSVDNLRGKSTLRKRLKDFDLFLGYSETTLKAISPHIPKTTAVAMLQGGYDPERWPFMERDWNSPRFSFIAHGQMNLRKDIHTTINAFIELQDEYPEEFKYVEFHVHTTENSLPKIMETVIPNFRIHYETWPEEVVRQFYQSGHVLISSSHGEGKNLPCLEMLSTGGSVIATAFSGHLNWLSDAYAYPLDCKVVPVHEAKYGPDCKWAAADKDHLKQLMLHVVRNRQEVKRKGELGAQLIPQMCSWDKVVQDLFRTIGDKIPGKGRELQLRFDAVQREMSN